MNIARQRPRSLDVRSRLERTLILRATTQGLGATTVFEAVVQRLDMSQKHPAGAYTLAGQYETIPVPPADMCDD